MLADLAVCFVCKAPLTNPPLLHPHLGESETPPENDESNRNNSSTPEQQRHQAGSEQSERGRQEEEGRDGDNDLDGDKGSNVPAEISQLLVNALQSHFVCVVVMWCFVCSGEEEDTQKMSRSFPLRIVCPVARSLRRGGGGGWWRAAGCI